MPRWERTVEISAAPATIWRVMSDIETWPEWTPSILSVEKPPGEFGPAATAVVQAKGTPKSTYRVTRWEPEVGFDWETRSRGATAIAGHWIEPAGDGRSRVTLSVEVKGFVAALLKPLLGKGITGNLELEAAGLKRRSESAS